ncbi:MAG TPA: YbaK/EbsC family protein [Gammaproteobacteria bacterium]
MAIAMTLKEYLEDLGIQYDVLRHVYTDTSMETAQAAHIPGDKLVKSVLLKDDKDYVMAVVPSTCHVQLSDLTSRYHRRLQLVSEAELAGIFTDCEIGAIPPIGHAYAIDMIVDNKLLDCDDVYIEAGDHKNLVHLRSDDFKRLISNSKRGDFTRHV